MHATTATGSDKLKYLTLLASCYLHDAACLVGYSKHQQTSLQLPMPGSLEQYPITEQGTKLEHIPYALLSCHSTTSMLYLPLAFQRRKCGGNRKGEEREIIKGEKRERKDE